MKLFGKVLTVLLVLAAPLGLAASSGKSPADPENGSSLTPTSGDQGGDSAGSKDAAPKKKRKDRKKADAKPDSAPASPQENAPSSGGGW